MHEMAGKYSACMYNVDVQSEELTTRQSDTYLQTSWYQSVSLQVAVSVLRLKDSPGGSLTHT